MPDVHVSEMKRSIIERYLRGDIPGKGNSTVIGQRPQRDPVPLSFAQEQLWRRDQMSGIPPLFNEAITVRRKGPLDVAILERSIAEIISRHEIWRTTYETSRGQPIQIPQAPPAMFPLTLFDLSPLPEGERAEQARQIAAAEARRPFDLKQGPLLRAVLVRMSDQDHLVLVTAHLSIVDGLSVYQLFPTELALLYEAFARGRKSPLPALEIQYADYAYWQRNWFSEHEIEKQMKYWRAQLAGVLPTLKWPNRPRPAAQSFKGAIEAFVLPSHVGHALKTVSAAEQTTLFSCLQAGFVAMLYGYTGQNDIIIGTFSPCGRKRSEVQKLLGHFLNPVPLRLSVDEGMSFSELLRHTRRVTAEAVSNDDLPIEVLARRLPLEDDASRHPFFTTAISLQPRMPELAGWWVTSMDADSGGALWDLYLAFIETPTDIIGRAQYNPDLFDTSMIQQMIQDFSRVVVNAAQNSHMSLSRLQLPNAA